MKYLITGITGFVGPHLAKLLIKKNHEVHGLIRGTNGREMDLLDVLNPLTLSKITFHKCDLLHYAGLKKIIEHEMFDGVFHLAAQSDVPTSFADQIMTFENNVMGTVNLIEAIGELHTVLQFTSSSEVYGNFCKDNGMVTETDPIQPVNPYGCSKAAMDLYVQERIGNGFINGFITRAFSHTGPRRGKNFSISSDAYQLALISKGRQKPILKVGNLQTERVVIDVNDVAIAYYRLMKMYPEMEATQDNNVFNICGAEVRKMEYFTDTLIDIAGVKVEKVVHPPFYRDIDIQVQIGDSTKINKMTSWKPIVPIAITLGNLFDYWMRKIR